MAEEQQKKEQPEKKTPPRKTWDWPLEKEAFFKSDYLEPTTYFRGVHGMFNAHIMRKVKGWAKEKEAWQEEQSKQALKEFAKKRSRLLAEGLNDAILAAQEGLGTVAKDKMGIKAQKALKTFWHILRVEAGLPTNVLHNTNVNENLERDADAVDDIDKTLGQDSEASARAKAPAAKAKNPAKGKSRKAPETPAPDEKV